MVALPPYGYQLINGELHIAEDEAEVIRIIYDKFANTTMGIAAIAAFLNTFPQPASTGPL